MAQEFCVPNPLPLAFSWSPPGLRALNLGKALVCLKPVYELRNANNVNPPPGPGSGNPNFPADCLQEIKPGLPASREALTERKENFSADTPIPVWHYERLMSLAESEFLSVLRAFPKGLLERSTVLVRRRGGRRGSGR